MSVEGGAWWFKKSPTPTPLISDGYLDEPGTKVLLGGGDVDTNPNGGFKVSATWAMRGNWALEANFFYVGSRSMSRGVASDGTLASTDLLLPYIDATTGEESVGEVSFSPVYSGSAQATFENSLWGAEVNAAWPWSPMGSLSTDLIAGFRYLRLREKYTLDTASPNIAPFPADIYGTTDVFDATNNFYGGQVGLRLRYADGPWRAAATAKVALGAMQQAVNVSGSLATNDYNNYGAPQTFVGGSWALPSNIGNHSRTEFAVVPEVTLNLGYAITPTMTVYAGYAFLYASSVVRPGEQVSRTLNVYQSTSWTGDPNQKPTLPAQPSFNFNTSSFWAQSLTAGIAFRF